MSASRFPYHRAVAFLAAGLAAAVFAQPYPSKPIEFVVHVNPGGGTDVFARLVTEIMNREKLVSQPLVVQNRPGGSGVVAFTYVKGKRGDPHTVLAIATGSFLTAAARTDLDLGLEHFTPLAFFARDPQGVMVHADSKYKTLYEDRWMGSAEFTKYLAEERAGRQEFIESIGLGKK